MIAARGGMMPEIDDLVAQAQAGDQDARARVLELSYRLIWSCALCVGSRLGEEWLDELRAFGAAFVLEHLLPNHRRERGRFFAHSKFVLRREMKRHVDRQFLPLHIPQGELRAARRLYADNPHGMPHEASPESDMTRAAYRAFAASQKTRWDPSDASKQDRAALDEAADPREAADWRDMEPALAVGGKHWILDQVIKREEAQAIRDQIQAALACLDDHERWVVEHRILFPGLRPRRYTELGRECGYSRTWVQNLEKRALEKIKAYLTQED